MKVTRTELDGVVIIEPDVFGDARGYFMETYSEERYMRDVCATRFVQDNESKSRYGVVRGLHFQRGPHAQSKLVRVVCGRVLDVVADIRVGSPSFGRWIGVELSGDNRRQLFVPRGFAHGFAVLSEEALLQYKCDNLYAPHAEGGVAWNDAALAIDWGLPAEEMIISDKDSRNPSLAEAAEIGLLFEYGVNLYE